jgi:MFS family permease
MAQTRKKFIDKFQAFLIKFCKSNKSTEKRTVQNHFCETNELKEIKNSRFFYGWIITIVAAIGLFFSGPGQTYSISLFIEDYVHDFGWSRTMISTHYSIATLAAGLLLPLVGKAVDAQGHRKMMTFTAAMLGLVCLWMSFITKPEMLIVGFFLLRLLGQGSMSLIPSTLVPQWFVRNRGKALSLMSLGNVAASTLFPPLNNIFITHMGIRFTWRIWAALLIIFMAPIGWIFVRNRPEDMGCLPDGKAISNDTQNALEDAKSDYDNEYPWTLKEAMKTHAFWLMLFCMIFPSMINTGITFHMVSIVGEKGFSSTFAAFILSFIALIQVPLTFIAGHFIDKAKVHHVKAVNYGILFIAILFLLYGHSKSLLLLYGMLHGIFVIFDLVSTNVLWPNYYGRKHIGSIRSITMTAFVIGSALGPLPFGYAYDIFGGYREILLIMMAFPALGTFAALLSPAPKRPSKKQL